MQSAAKATALPETRQRQHQQDRCRRTKCGGKLRGAPKQTTTRRIDRLLL
jgi:hypothetical protein